MAGHTPGPWIAAAKISSVVGLPVVASPEGRMICKVNCVAHGQIGQKVPGDGAFNRESIANARLIAAAPDLLAACRAAADYLEMDGRGEAIARLCRAAIARAEGKDG